ncbi:pentatricopeptide repeat-containing protein At3g62890-like [Phragmites australis]|uniref:pentatricopeptide repeat-containing protein At3g62890-like n=1 Tax=Phragmites australis TaxID=29695 RepID=UPI002D77F8D7|nr:pentatricopeptide repeat-containing protein At3g62890-like [Phragmites australis]XP_062194340.1 pentatricopeptide repeat-containing protein At3g62890-like [Phragmites australis]XP_062194349.1 pentatricopeptide repeat-containing protein At3g62890-like [Phragmites australis]XP_062194356.1 pentatricopeptide repeat-containing protein At3g62890-like [Phragmites australis]XP_062194364.1 pentatricopeptide repeat-containing protein At3g62890-like [Phragmites australis]
MLRAASRARGLLDGTPHRAAPRWNPATAGFRAYSRGAEDAVAGYAGMLARGVRPDAYTFPSLLKAVARGGASGPLGGAVHAHVVKSGLERNAHVASSLILLYAARGDGAAARVLLDACAVGGGAPVAWNAFISGHNRVKRFVQSCCSFVDMVRAGVMPTAVTYVSVLSACGKVTDVLLGMQVHKRVVESGVLPDLAVENALVDMYAECTDMDTALKIFDGMQLRNVVSWTSVISGLVRLGQVDGARALFDRMPERDTVSWTAMIVGCVQSARFREALETFREMQYSNVRADEFTMVSVITACAQLGALEMGEWTRIYMSRHGIKVDVFIGNALIDMYSKCGIVERAFHVFKEMRIRDKFTWTTMILGLAVNGYGEEAIDMFHRMIKVLEAPDEVTFIGVLTACTHAGLVDKGREFFLSMIETYKITPSLMHYGCMIDLLGRSGKLAEALTTIGQMPMTPNSTIWGTLLAACRVHGNSEIGELAAERLLELDPENSMAYILLSNMYAKSSRWGDVRRLRQAIMEKGIKKEPGCSLIEMNGMIHEFVAGDRSHLMSKEIYSKLDKMLTDLRGAGYVPDVTEVFVEVGEEEKQKVVYWHSEKLAIAFALLSSESNVAIRIVKNLRMCLDCHNAIKLISKLYGREVIVRDRTRFHHFRHGFCSCKDYW